MRTQRRSRREWKPSSVLRSTVFLAIEHAVNFLAGFAISVLLIRMLAVQEFGLYQLVQSLAALSIYFFNFGFTRITLKAAPEQIALGNRQAAVLLHAILTLMRIGVVAVMALLAYLYRDALGDAFNAGPLFDEFVLIVLAYIVLANFHDYFSRGWLTAVMRRDLVSVGMVLRRLVLLLWVVVMGLTVPDVGLALWGLFASMLAEALVLGWQSVALMRQLNVRNAPPAALQVGKLLGFGVQAWIWEILQFCRDRAAMALLISALRGPEFVALQQISRLIPDTVRNFSPAKAGLGILVPKIASRMAVEGGSDTLRFVFTLLMKLNFLLWGAAIILLALNFDLLFPLIFGDRYAGQVIAGILFAISALIGILIDPYYLAANATHEGGILMGAGVVGTITMPIAYVLIPEWGVEGAAVAGIVSGIALLIYFSVLFSAKGYPYMRFPLALAATCCLRLAVIPLAFYALREGLTALGVTDGLVIRAVISVLTAGLYIASFRFSHPFEPDELQALRARIPWLARKITR